MDNLPIVEDVVEKKQLIFDIDIKKEDFVSELAWRSIGKNETTVELIRYNNHIIYVNNIDNFFICFDAQFAIHFSTKQTTSSYVFFVPNIESKTFIQKMFNIYERRCSRIWMGSI